MHITIDKAHKKALGITFLEYAYLKEISQLQAWEVGWCTKPNDAFAVDYDLSRSAIQRMTKRLVEKGLLIKGKGTYKRASDAFLKGVAEGHTKGSETPHLGVAKRHSGGSETPPKTVIKREKGNSNIKSIGNDQKKKNSLASDIDKAINNLCPYPEGRAKEEWQNFWEHRKQLYTKTRKYPITELAVKKISNKLKEHTPIEGIEAIEQSIANGYPGVYPKSSKPKRATATKPKTGTSYEIGKSYADEFNIIRT